MGRALGHVRRARLPALLAGAFTIGVAISAPSVAGTNLVDQVRAAATSK